MKHIFMINPVAGKKKIYREIVSQIAETAEKLNVKYEIHYTLKKGDMVDYIKKVGESGEYSRVYACGGDGTIHTVLNALYGFENIEFAIIPYGTGNDFARNFNDINGLRDIKNQILGETVPIDIIDYGDGYCMNMINIGVDADIALSVAEKIISGKTLFYGSLEYLVTAMSKLAQKTKLHLKIETDTGYFDEKDVLLTCMGKGGYCGGGFNSLPKNNLSDGFMDLCVVDALKPSKIFSLILAYHGGTHVNNPKCEPYVHYCKCKRIEISSRKMLNICVDGEKLQTNKISLKIIPEAVKINVPKGCSLKKIPAKTLTKTAY